MKVLLLESRDITEGQNIALGYLTASLKKSGIEVAGLSEANLLDYPPDLLEKYMIEKHQPDLIGITMFYCSYYLVRDMIKRIKAFYDCPIVVGGPQMNIEGANILRDIPNLDYAMVGEAEHSLVNLCQTIEKRGDLRKVSGLIWRDDNGQVIINQPIEVERNLDSLPFPSYDEFGIDKISAYSIMTARGCPFHCHFCFRSTRIWRARSPENIIDELLYAKERFRPRVFRIVDDSCNIRPKRMIRFCNLLKRSGINLPWSLTGARLDRMPNELIIALRDSGCEQIGVGVETLQQDVFANINKGETLDQIKDAIQRLRKHGLFTSGNFIIGLPGDTPEKTWDTYLKAKRLGLGALFFTILLPFPGTKMYDMIYSRSDVRRIRDYKESNIYWFNNPRHSIPCSPFEVPEYTEKEKISMFHRLWVREGYPKPRHHKSLVVMGLRGLGLILKYDPFHTPQRIWHMANLVRQRIARNYTGKARYQDIIFRKDFLPPTNELQEMYGFSELSPDT